MDRLIYTAMTGATAALNRQGVISANLANASTPGFKAELSTYRAVPVQGEGMPTRVLALEATAGYLDSAGPPISTGNPLDVKAMGNAWFAVQGLDGLEAYTRAGSLSVSQDGTLLGPMGLPVLDEGGAPMVLPAGAEPTVGSDGTITVKQGNQPPTALGRLKLVTPSAEQRLSRGIDGLFRSVDENPLPADPTAKVQSGVIEGSNVNSVEAMVSMIHAARQFEAQMRLLHTAESNDKSAAQLLSHG